jgi:2-deoxy-D-gluconate 3-dehydrogenase
MNILDKFRLDGKTALVTGCSRGVGLAIAKALAEAGADIIGVSRNLKSGSEVEQYIRKLGRSLRGYSCDFSDRKALYRFIEQVKRDVPRVDILVNNAGIIIRKPVLEHSDEFWDKVIEVNLTAPFILAREFAKEMVARGWGKILFIASILSFQGGIFVPSYAASKGGICQLMKALANELAGKGVNVNAIAPGYISTDLTTEIRADESRNRQILERIPAGRWGIPDDICGAAVFLCSDASNYIHGEILIVDGGWMAR